MVLSKDPLNLYVTKVHLQPLHNKPKKKKKKKVSPLITGSLCGGYCVPMICNTHSIWKYESRYSQENWTSEGWSDSVALIKAQHEEMYFLPVKQMDSPSFLMIPV